MMTNIATSIEAAVCKDIADRQALGIRKYGTSLQDNPATLRERLQHAYEECLDQAAYLKWAITEIDAKAAGVGGDESATDQQQGKTA